MSTNSFPETAYQEVSNASYTPVSFYQPAVDIIPERLSRPGNWHWTYTRATDRMLGSALPYRNPAPQRVVIPYELEPTPFNGYDRDLIRELSGVGEIDGRSFLSPVRRADV